MIFSLYISVKKAKKTIDTEKHGKIRILVLIFAIPIIFLVLYLIDGRSGILGAFYLCYYFFGVWLVYLLIEAILFYIIKQNKLANVNMRMFVLSLALVAISTFIFFNSIQ